MKVLATVAVPHQYEVTLLKSGRGQYRVTYGAHIKRGLTREEAAQEFGECVMHALACNGELDD